MLARLVRCFDIVARKPKNILTGRVWRLQQYATFVKDEPQCTHDIFVHAFVSFDQHVADWDGKSNIFRFATLLCLNVKNSIGRTFAHRTRRDEKDRKEKNKAHTHNPLIHSCLFCLYSIAHISIYDYFFSLIFSKYKKRKSYRPHLIVLCSEYGATDRHRIIFAQ